MKRRILCCLLLLSTFGAVAQTSPDSCSFRMSLLTCAPGTDLYSLFGHTAIRVRDDRRGMDIVYNYGTFDDSDPLFYFHFTRGIMIYSLSAETFADFMQEYQYEHRGVVEQVINLDCKQKNILYEALRKNTLEENRFYTYRFHTDNCTTRAGLILEDNAGGPLVYPNVVEPRNPSFRDMINDYLNRQHQYWSEFGINILLGVHLDKKPTNLQAIHFLPDYLKAGFDHATVGNNPFVLQENILLAYPPSPAEKSLFTPTLVFWSLFFLSLILYAARKNPQAVKAGMIFDIIYFGLVGLIGIVMAYVWIFRVDDVCRDNFNIAWALPTHVIIVFFYFKKAGWIKTYFLITAALSATLLAGFPWWPQQISYAVIPILLTIIFRSLIIYKNRKHAEDNPVSGKTGHL